MKKYFNYLGIIAAAAMTLVSCAKEADNFTAEEPIKDGGEFSIVANPATKTTIDGYQTKWAAGDAINLFHAVAGSTATVSDAKFTISSEDLASGTFKGTVSEALTAAAYDWYAIYPYNSYLESVKNDNANPARTYIGRRSDEAQEQDGNSSTAHLSGTNFPLFGKATSVAKDATPAITLSSIASFVEVKVTNKNDDPLTVTSVSFTAPDESEIVGQYIIDFSTEPFTFTKYKTYVSDVANLTVNNGTPIAKGETASFYIGIKPFTAAAGSDFKVSVNGYEKTIHTAKANTFQSGKIKTVNFDYDDVIEPAKTYTLYTGSIVEGDYLIVADDVAMKAAVSSNRFAYNTVSIVSNSITTNDASIVWHIAPSGEYWTIYNEDAAKYAGGNETKNQGALLDAATDGAKWTITNGAEPTIVNYANTHKSVNATLRRNGTYGFACYGTSTGTMPVLYKLDNNADPIPLVTALKSAISDVPAAGVSSAHEAGVYSLTNAVDGDVEVSVDGTVVTAAVIDNGSVMYDVAENVGAARSGWIKIAVDGGNTVQIDVNQLGASGGTPSSETITFADLELSNGVQYADPFDGGNFTITFAGGGNDGKYYTTGEAIRTYVGGTITVASTLTISEIEFIWSGASYAPSADDVASPSGYSTSTNKWTGSSKSVVLTRPSGSGHWRLQGVTVTYE